MCSSPVTRHGGSYEEVRGKATGREEYPNHTAAIIQAKVVYMEGLEAELMLAV